MLASLPSEIDMPNWETHIVPLMPVGGWCSLLTLGSYSSLAVIVGTTPTPTIFTTTSLPPNIFEWFFSVHDFI